jgi:hypothetical protein
MINNNYYFKNIFFFQVSGFFAFCRYKIISLSPIPTPTGFSNLEECKEYGWLM